MSNSRRCQGIIAAVLATTSVGCSSNNGSDSERVDAAPSPDAEWTPCTVQPSYAPTDVGSAEGSRDIVRLQGTVGPGTLLDMFMLAGQGTFANANIADGTYDITDTDLLHNDCGLCLTIYTDITTQPCTEAPTFGTKLDASGAYVAKRGTLTLSSATTASGTMVTGTLSNVELEHVYLFHAGCGLGAGLPEGDTCRSTIPSATFRYPLQ